MIHGVAIAIFIAFLWIGNGQKQPHIVFVVADDLGWNDVSWHNPKLLTPNLETLAKEGVILNQSYVQPICTPSRVAFMTGYYPFRVGRQNHVLHPLVPTGVPLQLPFLSEKLKEMGYSTHLIGKWHLGYCNLSYTPTFRGFDTFFGFYNGALDYFSHTRSSKQRGPNARWNEVDTQIGLDLRNNTKLSRKYNGVYSTKLLSKVAKELISSQSPDSPMFLFLSFQSVHSPLQVPKVFEDMYSHIQDEKRRKYSGMVTAMDKAVGVVVSALKENGFWDDCVFIFTTDNGGQTAAGGNNWPLRGNKGTLWEGGTRAVTFVHGSHLKKKGYVNDKLFHAVDWFPTLIKVAGGEPARGINGIDQWRVISEDSKAVRDEIVYNIYDLVVPKAAIRIGDLKLIQGFPGKPSGWIAPPDGSVEKSIHCRLKKNDTLETLNSVRLFNLKKDPLERYNIAKKHPHEIEKMTTRLDELRKTMITADDPSPDERGEPKLWRYSFSPGWCIAK